MKSRLPSRYLQLFQWQPCICVSRLQQYDAINSSNCFLSSSITNECMDTATNSGMFVWMWSVFFNHSHTVYSAKYSWGIVMQCFDMIVLANLIYSFDTFTHIFQGRFHWHWDNCINAALSGSKTEWYEWNQSVSSHGKIQHKTPATLTILVIYCMHLSTDILEYEKPGLCKINKSAFSGIGFPL